MSRRRRFCVPRNGSRRRRVVRARPVIDAAQAQGVAKAAKSAATIARHRKYGDFLEKAPHGSCAPALSLRLPLAFHSGQNAKLAHNQQIDVHRLLVPHQMHVPVGPLGTRPVSFHMQDHVFFMFQPPRVL